MSQTKVIAHEEVGVNWGQMVITLVVALALLGGGAWWMLH